MNRASPPENGTACSTLHQDASRPDNRKPNKRNAGTVIVSPDIDKLFDRYIRLLRLQEWILGLLVVPLGSVFWELEWKQIRVGSEIQRLSGNGCDRLALSNTGRVREDASRWGL